LLGLKFGEEADHSDQYLIDEYIKTVKRRIGDLYQIRARARKKCIPSFEMYTIGKAEKQRMMWQISEETQQMVGWLLQHGTRFRPSILKSAGNVLRYHNAEELKRFEQSMEGEFSADMLKEAIIQRLNYSQQFVQMAADKLQSLRENPEFACFKDCPWILKQAVLHRSRNTEDFLRGAIVKIAELQNNPEFLDLRPTLIKFAVVNNYGDPEKFLRGKMAGMNQRKACNR
jgi:hypothetical protein